MTSNSPPAGRIDRASHDLRASAPQWRSARGFTLTELIVVIGIIVLVLSIATPMISRAWRNGDRARTSADLQAIATALEAYRQDHGDYPEVPPPTSGSPLEYQGAVTLCRALIGPADAAPPNGDGADGPGFRTRGKSGRVYGPYLKPESFSLGNPSTSTTAGTGPDRRPFFAILDRYNKPILYYRAIGKPNIRLAKGFVWVTAPPADKPMYNAHDNRAVSRLILSPILGDLNANGMIDGNESPAHEGPFVLWSGGPDETFGVNASAAPPVTGPVDAKDLEKCDDITNFRQ